MSAIGASSAKQIRVRAPDVIPPYAVRNALSQLFSPAILQILPHLLPEVPKWIKVLFWTLIVTNIKSFPLLWHIRTLGAAVVARSKSRPSIHPLLPWIRSNQYATTMPGITPRLRLDKVPVGRDIFADRDVTLLRATPDDCDWNGHMSNSCYPKNLDYTRMSFLASRFLRVHFDGGHFALGGCAFVFHREVPFMAKYEIEISIGAWDDKWLYVVGRFLSPSKPIPTARQMKRSKSAQNLKRLMSEVTKPQHEAEELARKQRERGIDPAEQHLKDVQEEAKRINAERTLYCTSISRYCFKAGRKTIPPWFVIATSGYGTYASTRTNWDKAEHLRRNILARTKADYQEQHGRPLPRDNLILGSGYRRGGILKAYDPSRKQDDSSDESGLGAWQDQSSWHLAEWEERRVEGLKLIGQLGGLAQPNLVQASETLVRIES